MKLIASLLFFFCLAICQAAVGDSVGTTPRKYFFKHKKEESSTIVEKMSDALLLKLIDYMFEAKHMPPDLWSHVMMETTKRNLNKTNIFDFDNDSPPYSTSGTLHIEKPQPDSIAPLIVESNSV